MPDLSYLRRVCLLLCAPLLLGLALLAALLLAGCGLVADGVNKARAVQFSQPDELYWPDFYRQASPDQVRAVIAGRSLAEESFTRKEYDPNERGGIYADVEKKLRLFLPGSKVNKWVIYPLEVALANTPHPEVIQALLQAGAPVRPGNLPDYLRYGQAGPEVIPLLLERADAEVLLEALEFFASRGEADYVSHCLALAPRPWSAEELAPALLAALKRGPNRIAADLLDNGAQVPPDQAGQRKLLYWTLKAGNTPGFRLLLARGAVWPEEPDWQNQLLAASLQGNNVEGFWELLKRGADCGASNELNLFKSAYLGQVRDESLLLQLARSVPLDEQQQPETLSYLCAIGNPAVLDAGLARLGGLPDSDDLHLSLLSVALENGHKKLFWHLVKGGARCGGRGEHGQEKNLMLRAYLNAGADRQIMLYLAERVNIRSAGQDSLKYTALTGNLPAVRALLQRGLKPDRSAALTISASFAGPAEREQIRTVLQEHGFTVRREHGITVRD